MALHHGQPGGQTRGQRQFCSDVAGQVAWGRVLLRPRLLSVVSREEEPTRSCIWGDQEGARGLGWGVPGAESHADKAGAPQGSPRVLAEAADTRGTGWARPAWQGPVCRKEWLLGLWQAGTSQGLRGAGFVCLCPSAHRGKSSESLERSLGTLKGHAVKWS